ncbi:MAG: Asp23/Gls24 family envelope stress response protein [Gaiellaceae bacterium]
MSYVVEERAGTITVTPAALAELVIKAAETVDGARVRRGRRRLDVDLSNGDARVRLELVARYGTVLPAVAREVQAKVSEALATICAVPVAAVDVAVEGVE